MTTTPQINRETKPWRIRCRIALCLALSIATLLLLLPVGMRLGLQYWLNKQPHTVARIDDIDLNLFTGRLQVANLIVQQQGQTVLRIKELGLQLDWWPLWQQRLNLQNITLTDGMLRIEQSANQPPIIGGWRLATAASTQPLVVAETKSTTSWGINTGTIHLKDFQVNYQHRQQNLAMDIKTITATPMISWQPDLVGEISGELSINGAQLQLDGRLQPFAPRPSAKSSLSITSFPLPSISPLLANYGISDVGGRVTAQLQLNVLAPILPTATTQIELQGSISAEQLHGATAQLWLRNLGISWDGAAKLGITAAATSRPAKHLQLSLDATTRLTDIDLELQRSGLHIQQQRLTWEGKLQFDHPAPPAAAPLQLHGNLTASATTINDLVQQRQFATVQQIAIDDLQCLSDAQLTSTKITLSKLNAFQRYSPSAASTPVPRQQIKPAPNIVHIDSATLNNAALCNFNHLKGQQLHVQGLQLRVTRTASGAWELKQWLSAPATTVSSVERSTPEPAATSFSVQLDQLQIDSASNIFFDDYTVQPSVALQLNNLALTLDNIASNKPQQKSKLTLKGQLDQYSHLNIAGSVQPFVTPAQFNLAGKLNEFRLPTLAPYVAHSIGYRLNQGQLNVDFSAPCSQGKLNLDTNIFLHQLRLQPISPQDDVNATASLGMPVNMALALLRDSAGDIHLKLPVHGDLTNPSLKLGPIMRLALGNAVKNSVLLTLAPLGIVSQAGHLLGIGNTLTFERLQFIPGTVTMTPETKLYLHKIATLLTQHPQITLTLQGYVSNQDIAPLQSNSANPPLLTEAPALPTPQLLALAQQRTTVIKDALLAQQVASAQLLVAQTPSVITTDTPGVDLVLQ